MRAMHHVTIDAPLVEEDGAVFSVINANSPIFRPVEVWNIQPIGEEQYTPLHRPEYPVRCGATYACTTGFFFFRILDYPRFTLSLFSMVEVAISKWGPDVAPSNATLKVDRSWFADAES